MQLTIKGGEKRVKVLKPELKKLHQALEVLQGLADCGDPVAGKISQSLKGLVADCESADYGSQFSQQRNLLPREPDQQTEPQEAESQEPEAAVT